MWWYGIAADYGDPGKYGHGNNEGSDTNHIVILSSR